MTKYKLSYFDIYGRAEISRLMFAAAKVEYEDHRFTIEDWPSVKSSTPFGQVPVLFVDDFPISQSGGIIRYLATVLGYNGSTPMEVACCEMVLGTLDDVFSKLPFMEQDQKLKEEKTESIWKETIYPALQKLENDFKKKNSNFIVGEKLTYADLAIMQTLIMAQKDCPNRIKDLTFLCSLRDRVKEVDGIKEYLASRPVCSI